MDDKKWDKLESEMENHIREFVEQHPLYRGLAQVEKRNMAYCGATAAVNALTRDAIATVDAKLEATS